MKTYNVGIIGYGGFGRFLHNCWKNLDRVKIYALADKSAWQYDGTEPVHIFSEWRNLVHDKNVDIVSIVTVPYTHEIIATAAMKAGKAVLIEKPLATNIIDAQKIIDVRNHAKVVASIDYVMRYNPLMEIIAKLTKNNAFGKLRRVDLENYAQDEQLPPHHWFWEPKLAGGILIEHAVHFIDLVHYITGNTKYNDVYGFAHKRNPTQEDRVMADVIYDDGLIATHYHSFARPGFFEITTMRLAYDLAQIDLVGWIPLKGKISVMVNQNTRDQIMQLPNLEIISIIPISDAQDESRPKGWGTAGEKSRDTILSGGIEYNVDEIMEATFDVAIPKQEVYGRCVQSALMDVVQKLDNPEHTMRVSLEDGLASLDIAQKATELSRR